METTPLLTVIVSEAINSSGQKPKEEFFDGRVEWISLPCEGNVSFTRNEGARRAKAPWILFVDGDCYFGPRERQIVLGHLKDHGPSRDVIWGALYRPLKETDVWGRAYNWMQRAWVKSSRTRKGYQNLLGGFLLIQKSRFMSLRGFDEAIPWAGEETEFLRRAVRAGLRLELIPGFEILHPKELSFRAFMRRAYMQGWSCGKFRLETQISTQQLWAWMQVSQSIPDTRECFALGLFMLVNRVAATASRTSSRASYYFSPLRALLIKSPTKEPVP